MKVFLDMSAARVQPASRRDNDKASLVALDQGCQSELDVFCFFSASLAGRRLLANQRKAA